MQTTIRIKADEIPDLMAILKTLFKKEKVVEITVKPIQSSSLEKKESREEYWARINKAIKDMDEGKNIVSFTPKEIEKYSNKLATKYK